MSPQIFIVLFILHKDYVFFNLFSIKSYDFLKKVYFSKTVCPFFSQNLLCILYIKKELSQYTVLFTIIYEKLQFSLVLLIPVFLLYVNLCPTVDLPMVPLPFPNVPNVPSNNAGHLSQFLFQMH